MALIKTADTGAELDWPSAKSAWLAVAILFIAYTFSFADRYILSLLIQPIKQDLGLSDTKISLLHGLAFAIFYTVMGIPIGRMADRYSRRTIIAAGIVCWSLMTAACGLARQFGYLFAARVGVGVGEAALSPAAFSLISDLFPPNKLGRALSIYSAGAIVGGGLAFIIGGMVVSAVMATPEISLPVVGNLRSWQLAFFVVGLPGVLVAAMMYLIKEPVRRTSANRAELNKEAIPLSKVFGHFFGHWRVYVPTFIGFTMLALIFNALLAWTPTFLLRSFQMPVGESGPAIGALLVVFGGGGLFVGGWLTDKLWSLGYQDATLRVGMIAGVGALPFAITAPLASSSSLALILFAPFWFFSASAFGAGVAAVQTITPNRMRGVISAMYLFCGNLIGIGLGPTAIALLTDYAFVNEGAVGYSMACIGAGGALLAAVILALGLKPFRTHVAQYFATDKSSKSIEAKSDDVSPSLV